MSLKDGRLSFGWFVWWDRLLTNEHRQKRHLCVDGRCERCNISSETVEHALKLCPTVRLIWEDLCAKDQVFGHSSDSFQNWVRFGCQNSTFLPQFRCPYHVVFISALWHIWRWRNKCLFQQDFIMPTDTTAAIVSYGRGVFHVFQESQSFLQSSSHLITHRPGLI